MAFVHTPDPANSSETITLPSDGDSAVAASVVSALQALSNRLKRIIQTTTADTITSIRKWAIQSSYSDGPALSVTSGTNQSAILAAGNGTGSGVVGTGGADAAGAGVIGNAGTAGNGVVGNAATLGTGVLGNGGSGNNAVGVRGFGGSVGGAGVRGTGTAGHGVHGDASSSNHGVYGTTTGTGSGVRGEAPDGAVAGVYGQALGSARGVYGFSVGTGAGVQGETSAAAGTAIQAEGGRYGVRVDGADFAVYMVPEDVTGGGIPSGGSGLAGGLLMATRNPSTNVTDLYFHTGNGGWVKIT